MTVRIQKSNPCGTVAAPASKSYAHRLLIGSGLAQGTSTLTGLSVSEDILATADCLTALGASVSFDGETATVTGSAPVAAAPLACRESGSTLRFFIPLALLQGGGDFIGSERLLSRGVSVYEQLLTPYGITFSASPTTLSVRGTLKPNHYRIAGNISSQFITGLLFALPLLSGDSQLEVVGEFESRAYVDITLDTLAQNGIAIVRESDRVFSVAGNQHYRPLHTAVEGDWSNAAFFHALRTLGNAVTVMGLRADSKQGDRRCLAYLNALSTGSPTLDLRDCPDLAPILFTVAAAKHGGIFEGTERLSIKESDRANVMAEELAKCGADITVEQNRVVVRNTPLHTPTAPFHGHNDHRVVMSLAVLSTVYGGCIEGAEAVSKSYPSFFKALQSLGVEVETDA